MSCWSAEHRLGSNYAQPKQIPVELTSGSSTPTRKAMQAHYTHVAIKNALAARVSGLCIDFTKHKACSLILLALDIDNPSYKL